MTVTNDIPQVVLAALIAEQAQKIPALHVLTFVSIDESGNYVEEIRTFPQRIKAAPEPAWMLLFAYRRKRTG